MGQICGQAISPEAEAQERGCRWIGRTVIMDRATGRILIITLLVLAVVLRLIYLDSDAYARLSWSSALLTDEGFYLHNARNLLLFGHLRTDGFNNCLIMPLLHLLQVGVFAV